MTDKPGKQNQTITPAGTVELNEEELDQAAGGWLEIGKVDKKLDSVVSTDHKAEPQTNRTGWKLDK